MFKKIHRWLSPFLVASLALANLAAVSAASTATLSAPDTCTVFWASSTNGFWDLASNWSTNSLPGPTDDVCIDVAADLTVTFRQGTTATIHSLHSEEAFSITGGTLTVATSIQVNNTFTLNGGTLQGATILLGAAGQRLTVLTNPNNQVIGVTVEGEIELAISNALLRIADGMVLNGAIRMSGSGSTLSLPVGSQTLSGNGAIIFEGGTGWRYVVGNPSGSLTIGPGITLRGGGAHIGAKGGFAGTAAIVNQGTIQADVPGQTIYIDPISFVNQSTLKVIGGTLDVSNLTGTPGTVQFTGTGQLLLDGVYAINQPLNPPAGTILTLDGTYTIDQPLTVLAGSTLSLLGDWRNNNTLSAANATVNLGGQFTLADLGTFVRSGGAVNLVGTLDNTNTTLALNAGTGNWQLNGGAILNGAITTADGAKLTASNNTSNQLTGVSFEGETDLPAYAFLRVVGGTVLNGTVRMSGTDSTLYSPVGSQTLSGTGAIIFEGTTGLRYIVGNPSGTLTIGPDLTLRGGAARIGAKPGFLGTNAIVNQGTIKADMPGETIYIETAGSFVNQGTLQVDSGTIDILNPLAVDASSRVVVQPQGTLKLASNLLGNTTHPELLVLDGAVRFDGTKPAGNPQMVEAMGQDLGAVEAGFANNFRYSSLSVQSNTNVMLVDQADNSAGAGPEALYAEEVTVTAGSTLNLNGLHLYARRVLVTGSVVGGEITQVAQVNPITYGAVMPGTISLAGELDEWSFAGPAGRSVSIWLNPGSSGSPAPGSPRLTWAQLSLVGPGDTVVASTSNSQSGAQINLNDITLPLTGDYRIRVRAPAGHTTSTGNYLVRLLDSRFNEGVLQLNQQINGRIEAANTADRWRFSAAAGQQLMFTLINRSSPNLLFRLTGPGGSVLFDNLAANSGPISLVTSGNYLLTAYASSGQTGDYAFRLSEISQLPLTLGVPYTGTLAGSDQAQLFRVDIAQASPLSVRLTNSGGSSQLELYAKLGVPPTRDNHEYRSLPQETHPQVLVPMAAPGTWYILLYSAATSASNSYQLLAEASEVFVRAVTPEAVGDAADMTLTVAGAGFIGVASVELIDVDGVAHTTTGLEVYSPVQLTARVAAGSAPPGVYSVRVTRTDGATGQLQQALTIVADGLPGFETELVMPSFVGLALSNLYVEYANRGETAIPAPVVVLHGSDRALLTLDASRVIRGLATSAKPDGVGDTIQILAQGVEPGMLQPGEEFRIPVYYTGLQKPWHFDNPWVQFDFTVSTVDTPTPMDWDSLKEPTRPAHIDPATWDVIWANLVAQVGPTWGDYIRMLNDNAAYLGRLGQKVIDVNQLFAFELQQANGLQPFPVLGSAVDAFVPAPGLTLEFRRVFPSSIIGRNQMGPLGKGWYHFWQGSLAAQTDGTLAITGPDGSQRRFQPDARNPRRFFSPAGDLAELTKLADNSFDLREKNGVVRHYRPDGKFDSIVDTNGNRITAGYTGAQLTALTHSSGQFLQLAYNNAGLVETVTDSKGRVVHYSYDATNEHLIAVQDYDGRITRYTYSTTDGNAVRHALLSIEAPSGVRRSYGYDSHGRLTSASLNGGAERLDFAYGSTGAVSISDAAGGTSRLLFDHNGLPVQTVDPLGNVTRMDYDAAFNLSTVTDATGLVQRYAYDALRNLVGHKDALGQNTQFAYSRPFSNLTVVVDAKNNPTRYVYDSRGNPIETTYADTSVERINHDALGEPVAFTNRRGHTATVTRNGDGRVTQKLYADGGQIHYTYDARGNLASTTDTHGITTYTYDAGDRLTRVAYPGGRFLEYTYDSQGRRIRMADQDGFAVHYGYDAAGRLAAMTDTIGTPIVAYTYDSAGRLARSDLGNGAYATYDYDAGGQLIHLVNHAPGGGINSRFDYTYDALGRRTGMATLDGAWSYSYDATGQLIHAVFDSANASIADQDLTYEYDALGNRLRTLENGVLTSYASNSMNQYTQVGAATYTYDADGNLAARQGGPDPAAFTFDNDNRLVGLSSGAGAWSYEYDALGRRIASAHDGQRTEYLLDPTGMGNVVAEYDGAGNLVARYVHGLGLAARVTTTGTLYYDFDALGSVVGLAGASGAYLNNYSYLPFGESQDASETVTNPFAFVGRFGVMREGNGLDFMRARFYSSAEGRFLGQDPIGFSGGGINLYAYATNRPVTMIDPSGNRLDDFETVICNVVLGAACLGTGPFIPYCGVAVGLGCNINDENACKHFKCDQPPDPKPDPGPDPLHLCVPEFGVDCPPNPPSPPPPPPPPNPPNPPCLRNCRSGLIRSRDPNAKTGPGGFGPQGYIDPAESFAYRIDFENEATATAPAQRVDISDQLDANLDWSTLDFTSFGFGDTFVAVPPGSQYYHTTVSMVQDDQEFLVEVELGLYLDSGEIYVSYQSLDPETNLPPDVLTGFLPPEDGTGRGQGHVAYTIRPSASVTTGVEIRNVAVIRFDFAEVIATNQFDPHDPNQGTDPAKEVLNTIDATPPASQVQPLPPESPVAFAVSWVGDDGPGSGVATYDVFVSDNGAPYLAWQTAVTSTVASFTGVFGHTYAFYSVATDNVGHRESTPSAAQASTTVNTPLGVTLAWFNAAAQADQILVAWETVSEISTSGFNLYRAASDDWSSAALLATMPSQVPGSAPGFAYSVADANVQPGQSYWYWLEDVDLSGRATLHGPVNAMLLPPTAVTIAEHVVASSGDRRALPAVVVALVSIALTLAGASFSRRSTTPR